jgi:hypothetical protein
VTKYNGNANDKNYDDDDDSFLEEENHMIKTNTDDDEILYDIHNTALRNKKELLLYHGRMGYMPFKTIQHPANNGLLPKRLLKYKIPICPSCLYGKLSRKPWRTLKSPNKISTITIPGSFVSVDQMESFTPGLIAQMKGILRKQMYQIATTFVDHGTDLHSHTFKSIRHLRRCFELQSNSNVSLGHIV